MDMSEKRVTVIGGESTLWRNVMIEKVCPIENKVANMGNNQSEHYVEVKKQRWRKI